MSGSHCTCRHLDVACLFVSADATPVTTTTAVSTKLGSARGRSRLLSLRAEARGGELGRGQYTPALLRCIHRGARCGGRRHAACEVSIPTCPNRCASRSRVDESLRVHALYASQPESCVVMADQCHSMYELAAALAQHVRLRACDHLCGSMPCEWPGNHAAEHQRRHGDLLPSMLTLLTFYGEIPRAKRLQSTQAGRLWQFGLGA